MLKHFIKNLIEQFGYFGLKFGKSKIKYSNCSIGVKNIFFFLFFTVSSHCFSTTMYAFILCDQEPFDIRETVRIDYEKVSKKIEEIAQLIEVPLVKTIFSVDNYNESFFELIDSQPIDKTDIVLFYFSGHGFRPNDKESDDPWPHFFLSSVRKSIDYKEVLELLEEKNPRFMLSIADCCNNILPIKLNQVKKSRFLIKPVNHVQENYKELFLKFSGKIFIASSSAGEIAMCTRKYGGLFTNFFLEAFDKEIEAAGEVDWKNICNETNVSLKRFLKKRKVVQTPYIEMTVNYN